MTEHDKLVARAKELGIDGASSRWKEETLREKIEEAERADRDTALAAAQSPSVDVEALPEAAESLPVTETTEPKHVAANDARYDENHSETGAVYDDPEVLNPGEEAAAGGPQDRNYMEAVRKADESNAISSVMVANAEAGIHYQAASYEPETTGKRSAAEADEASTGAGGPSEKVG